MCVLCERRLLARFKMCSLFQNDFMETENGFFPLAYEGVKGYSNLKDTSSVGIESSLIGYESV